MDLSDLDSILTVLLLLADSHPQQSSHVIGHGEQHLPVVVYNIKVDRMLKNIDHFLFFFNLQCKHYRIQLPPIFKKVWWGGGSLQRIFSMSANLTRMKQYDLKKLTFSYVKCYKFIYRKGKLSEV